MEAGRWSEEWKYKKWELKSEREEMDPTNKAECHEAERWSDKYGLMVSDT